MVARATAKLVPVAPKVLALIAQGLSCRPVGREVALSNNTVADIARRDGWLGSVWRRPHGRTYTGTVRAARPPCSARRSIINPWPSAAPARRDAAMNATSASSSRVAPASKARLV